MQLWFPLVIPSMEIKTVDWSHRWESIQWLWHPFWQDGVDGTKHNKVQFPSSCPILLLQMPVSFVDMTYLTLIITKEQSYKHQCQRQGYSYNNPVVITQERCFEREFSSSSIWNKQIKRMDEIEKEELTVIKCLGYRIRKNFTFSN